MTLTRAQAVATATDQLSGLDNPRAEAIALLCVSESIDRHDWLMYPDQPLTYPLKFGQALVRRTGGESLASIAGVAAFFDFDLAVGPGVLIPRPDTETFAEVILGDGPIIDLGCGTGAIARWARTRRPGATIIAVERSLDALGYARRNLIGQSIPLVRSSWLSPFQSDAFGTVLSNPPYIDASEGELSGDGVCKEPMQALVAADQGLSDLKQIAVQALRCLRPQGWLWMEHGYQQAAPVQNFLTHLGYRQVQTLSDLAGHPRITGGQK